MGVLTLLVGAAAVTLGVVLWTMFTFVAVDQDDQLLWRVSPVLSGVVSGGVLLLVAPFRTSLLLAVVVTGLVLVLSTVFLGSFETARARYLESDEDGTVDR